MLDALRAETNSNVKVMPSEAALASKGWITSTSTRRNWRASTSSGRERDFGLDRCPHSRVRRGLRPGANGVLAARLRKDFTGSANDVDRRRQMGASTVL